MMIPAVFLLSIIFSTFLDIYEISKINPDEIYKDAQQILVQKTPKSFPLPNKNLKKDISKKTVFVFGESSLIISNGRTFPAYLEQEHSNLRVVNFGIIGIESTSIKQRVFEAISLNKPDIIILYYGHNDYNNLYQKNIVPKYFNKFNFLLKLFYMPYNIIRLGKMLPPLDYYMFSRTMRPRLFYWFEKLKFMNIDVNKYDRINELCLNKFINNTNQIIMMATAKHIPVILITPIGNLKAEPYGDITTSIYFHKGMTTRAYRQSIEYLKLARDREILSFDIRAKSPLVNFIRNFVFPNVYVLDLEKKLEEMHFDFGYTNFIDYFHFSDESNRLVANIIYDFMARNKLL